MLRRISSGRYVSIAVALVITIAALAASASARPGDIDPSFDKQGKFTGGPVPTAVAVQPDRKTLVLGTSTVLRLKANGRIDKPFGTGTFEPEGERVRYGLTTQLRTYRPVRVAFHEYIAIWHDIRRANRVRDKLGVVFRGPGWTPPGVTESEATRG